MFSSGFHRNSPATGDRITMNGVNYESHRWRNFQYIDSLLKSNQSIFKLIPKRTGGPPSELGIHLVFGRTQSSDPHPLH